MDVKVNYAAVAVAAVVMFFIGFLWYSVLFQAQWMAYTGVAMDQQMSGAEMGMTFGGSLVAYLIVFYVQTHVHHAFQVNDVKGAVQAAFWNWLGFILTAMFVTNAYQMKSFGLTLVDSSYWLVSMIAGGIILQKMKKQ
ncbi:MAG: DUF1761 domain-containing protein [Bacteroidetes bacterium]|nr:DUF1761 domain-containing protein [Bacteroidota bacterium]